MSAMAHRTFHLGAIGVVFFATVVMNLLANSSCNQLMKRIGEDERTLARLDDELERESARWEEMKTPENLERALYRHGLAMKFPRPDQYVYMRADGTPRPGQLSVTLARRAAAGGGTVARVVPRATHKRR